MCVNDGCGPIVSDGEQPAIGFAPFLVSDTESSFSFVYVSEEPSGVVDVCFLDFAV